VGRRSRRCKAGLGGYVGDPIVFAVGARGSIGEAVWSQALGATWGENVPACQYSQPILLPRLQTYARNVHYRSAPIGDDGQYKLCCPLLEMGEGEAAAEHGLKVDRVRNRAERISRRLSSRSAFEEGPQALYLSADALINAPAQSH